MASGLGKGNENHDCDLILKTMQVSEVKLADIPCTQGWQYVTVRSKFAQCALCNKNVTHFNLIFKAKRIVRIFTLQCHLI